MKYFNKEAFEAAAKWWANHLRDKNFKHGTGDEEIDRFARIQTAVSKPVTEKQIIKFEETLAKIIEKEYMSVINESMQESEKVVKDFSLESVSIYTEYEPDRFLTKAVQAAGIKDITFKFPLKMRMFVKNNEVSVRDCGGPEKTIYATKEPDYAVDRR